VRLDPEVGDEDDGEGGGQLETRLLGMSSYGQTWFPEDVFESAKWRNPEAALLRSACYDRLGEQVRDALAVPEPAEDLIFHMASDASAGSPEFPTPDHAEAIVFLQLKRMRKAEQVQQQMHGAEVSTHEVPEEGAALQALQDLARLSLNLPGSDDVLDELELGARAEEREEQPEQQDVVPAAQFGSGAGGPPSVWAVLMQAPPEADQGCRSPSAEETPQTDVTEVGLRPRLLLDAIAGDLLWAELRTNSGREVPAEPTPAPELKAPMSPVKLRRRLTSMSSTAWSDYSAPSPLASAVSLSPCVAVRELAERMREMGLPPLPEDELMASLRMAHWSADQALLEVVGTA